MLKEKILPEQLSSTEFISEAAAALGARMPL
jgi:hypothetical protein